MPAAETQEDGIDVMSPYYIHASDNPGQIFVSELLHDGNYGEWVADMSNALYAKNKIGFVDGTIPMPGNDSPNLAYLQCYGQRMAEECYEQGSQKQYDVFATVKTQILSMKPTVILGHAYHLVAEDEQQRLISAMHRPTAEVAAFQTQRNQYGQEGAEKRDWRKEKPKCGHCQKIGHTADRCYEVIGYPPDWKKSRREKKDKSGSWNDKKNGPKAAQVIVEGSPILGLSIQQYERLLQQLNVDVESNISPQQSQPNVNMAGTCYYATTCEDS
ncbi:Zinc finger, CCHC-type superfamily [Sesbania bispinosa]|nr:Zinc finger, CCHC-type superfamily [Sesbania bispinosa]